MIDSGPGAEISEKLNLSLEELIQRNHSEVTPPPGGIPTSRMEEKDVPFSHHQRKPYRPNRTTRNNRSSSRRDPAVLVSLNGPSAIRKVPNVQCLPVDKWQQPQQQYLTASSNACFRVVPSSSSKRGTAPPRVMPSDAALLSTEISQQENGDIVVRLKQTDIIVVKAGTGDLILNSGGYRTFLTKSVLNQALQPVGLWIEEEPNTGEWQISDGRSYLATFVDGMIIKQAGSFSRQQLLARGSVIMQFLLQRKTNAEKISAATMRKANRGLRRPATESLSGGVPDTKQSITSANLEAASALDRLLEHVKSSPTSSNSQAVLAQDLRAS